MSPRIIDTLADISGQYHAIYCDIWGVLHNGVAAFGPAVSALQAFRKKGGKVVLLTNAPRPRSDIEVQLDGLKVPRDAWDTIATSGDAARVALFSGTIGRKVYFMGEARDHSVLNPIKILDDPVPIETVELNDAEGILCAGPEDPRADPESWRPVLLSAKAQGLPLLCLNPDIVVDHGENREWCAGAVAQMYEDMGGEALYYGKPHAPIYDLARRRVSALGTAVTNDRVLAIGDGVLTDLPGALGEGIDCLFVTGGLAASETGTKAAPNPDALTAFLNNHQTTAQYAIGQLR